MRFDNELEAAAPPPLPIMVVKPGNDIRGILLCKDWVGVRTHWYGGHTIACCSTDNCLACEAGQKWAKKYYIVARGIHTYNLAILMITPGAADMISIGRTRVDGFLGCEIVLGRTANRSTAPMSAKLVGYHAGMQEFGQERLARVICRIFKENASLKEG